MVKNKNTIVVHFLQDTKKYYKSYIIAFISSLFAIIIGVAMPLTMQNIIDKGIMQNNLKLLLVYIFVALLLINLEYLFNFSTNIQYARIRKKYVYDTKESVLFKLSCLNGKQSSTLNAAELMNILEKDINEIADGLTDRIFLFMRDIFSACFSLFILLKINYKIFFMLLVLQGFIMFLNKKIGARVKNITNEYRKKLDIQKVKLQDEILNIEYLIQTNMMTFFNTKILQNEKRLNDFQYDINRYLSINIVCTGILQGVSSLVIWGIGGIAVILSKITLGEVYSINSYTNRFFSPLLRIADANIELKCIEVSLERLYSVLCIEVNEDFEIFEKELPAGIANGKITFENVYFSYNSGSKNILRDCNFQIQPKEVNLIIGKSGVGKTTVFKLLCKLWDVDKGAIYIDDVNISKIPSRYLRDQISLISQNTELFYGSIFSNVQMNGKKRKEDIYEICKKVGIYDEIMSFENGFNTIVGIEGKNLSGGQIQRIAIARALLKDSQILILDEPTSNLDIENKKKIMKLIFSISDRTIIIVSHDTDLISQINNIIVLDDGKAVKGEIK